MTLIYLIKLSKLQITYIGLGFFLSFTFFLNTCKTFLELMFFTYMNVAWLERFTIEKFADILEILIENAISLSILVYILPFFYITKVIIMPGWNFSQHKDWSVTLFLTCLCFNASLMWLSSFFYIFLHSIFNLKLAYEFNVSLEFNVLTLIDTVCAFINCKTLYFIRKLNFTYKILKNTQCII